MQVAAQSILTKTSRDIQEGLRNTSCNGGWLKLFTHIICGAFTVTSFIMILVFTVNTPRRNLRTNFDESRCQLARCRVICHMAPFYGEFEDDIVVAVMAVEENCRNVFLTLHKPSFTNDTLPEDWLGRLQPVVAELEIIGGNLHHIPQNAFSASFARNLRLLHLEKITIAFWTQHALLGLAHLENIRIKDCNIIGIQENFLSAVSQTLLTLTVVESGFWNPENLTGSSHLTRLPTNLSMLTSVDMSRNDFGTNLGRASFTRLNFCKSLYLGSNRMSYIEPGAFDKLIELEYLDLNDNLLIRIEPDLFRFITPSSTPRVRLNVVNNLLHCDCSDRELRRLTRLGVFLVDPTCISPKSALGKTFNEFITFCRKIEPKQIVAVDMRSTNAENNVTSIMNVTCTSQISTKFMTRVVSPFQNYECSVNLLNYQSHSKVIDPNDTLASFLIQPVIIFKGDNFTMIELSTTWTEGFGLVWYRNSCVNEVFCINIMPDTIRLYNIDFYTDYKFCPVALLSGTIINTQCIDLKAESWNRSSSITRLILLPLVAVVCLFFGALTLYMLIRKYPYLLKGSKRLLFVKHKTVDALVLPPKVPSRGVKSDYSLENSKESLETSLRHDFMRMGSVRSSHSVAASYISALQPTEEQLTNWRLKHANERFDNHYATISTISSDTPVSLCDSDHLYFSIENDSSLISVSDPFTQKTENERVSVF